MNASWMLAQLSLSHYVYLYVCCWRSKGRNKKLFNGTCTHGGLGITDGVCTVVSKNYIQVIVFYLLAQTKVIYICIYIYKPINKVS